MSTKYKTYNIFNPKDEKCPIIESTYIVIDSLYKLQSLSKLV